MKTKNLFIGFACLIIVCDLFFMTNDSQEKPEHSPTSVYEFQEPSPEEWNLPIMPIIGESTFAIRTGNPEMQPEAEINDVSPSGNPKILICDAIGQPIKDGAISAGLATCQFERGIFSCTEPLMEGNVLITADGYEPVTMHIDFLTNPKPVITMEYLSSYTIQVTNQQGENTGKNTIVKLWKAEAPPRPLKTTVDIYMQGGDNRYKTSTVSLQDLVCKFTAVSPPISPNLSILSPFGSTYPQNGDVLAMINICNWFTDPYADLKLYSSKTLSLLPAGTMNSTPLRIWDTLQIAENQTPGSFNSRLESFKFIRHNKMGGYRFALPEFTDDRIVFLKDIHPNSSGSFTAKMLHPGLYYIQARNDGCYSDIMPLHPASGNTCLILRNASHVIIAVKKEGAGANKNEFCINASIILQSRNNKQLSFVSATNDFGQVEFKDIPFGDYTLIVSSSAIDPFSQVEKEISVTVPNFKTVVSIPDWKRYAIQGIVTDVATRSPAAGYEVILSPDTVTKTDADGKFAFLNLPAGEYKIKGNIYGNDNLAYIPYTQESHINMLLGTAESGIPKYLAGQTIITGKNSSGLLAINVKKVIKTVFSGMLVDQRGKALPGVSISAGYSLPENPNKKLPLHTNPKHPITDTKGFFSLSVISDTAQEGSINFFIDAIQGHTIPARYSKPDAEGGFSLIPERFIPEKIGSLMIIGEIGKTFDNLSIVIYQLENKPYMAKF